MLTSVRSLLRRGSILLAVVLVGVRCEGWDAAGVELPGADDGWVEARFGGAAYVARLWAEATREPDGSVALTFTAHRPRPHDPAVEYLTLHLPAAAVGSHAIANSTAAILRVVGGDVVEIIYVGRSPTPGEAVITELDLDAGVVRGSMRFWLSPAPGHEAIGSMREFVLTSFSAPLTVR